MQEPEKYASVYKLVNLPKKRKLTSKMFRADNQTDPEVAQTIKEKTNDLIYAIQKQLQVYDNPYYGFQFPKSLFPDVDPDQRNEINYEFKMETVDQDTFKPKLTQKQVQQMREKGEFQVQSGMKNVTIPYVWKVNDRLLRGRQNIINIWENGLAWCYGTLSEALYNVKTEIPRDFKELAHLPASFFALIFGRKSLSQVYTPNYSRQVYKDFWTDIMSNQLKDLKNQIGHQLLQKIYLKYEPSLYQIVDRPKGMSQQDYLALIRKRDQINTLYRGRKNSIDDFKQKLQDVEQNFQTNWVKIRRKVLSKVSSQFSTQKEPVRPAIAGEQEFMKNEKIKEQDKKILEKFHEQKYTIYYAHLKENLPKKSVSDEIIEALVSLITIVSFIEEKLRLKHQSLADIKQKIGTDIDKKYRIRSKNYKYKNRLIEEAYQPIAEQIQKQFYEVLLSEQLKKYFPENYQSIYSKYIKLRNNFDKLVSEKKSTLKCLYVPQRVFFSTYHLLPPYQIIYKEGYYQMLKQKQMKIDTSENFWKFKLYGMRLKSWTINCAVFLIGFAWVGPTGIRCLFGTEDFKYDEYCDMYTGARREQKRSTVLGYFFQVLKGIEKSRQYFESLPDRGLFGKNFSRIFNYFECYVFRLLFVGIICVLILYPISILVLSVLCIVLVITVWLWVPLIMVVCYLFNILVFQFESSSRPNGILIRGVPLLSLAFKVISCIVRSLFAVVYLIIIAPISSLFYSLFLVIQRGFRTFTDEIMLFLIKNLGRTPSKDTSIARKISGPGMSRGYYYSIAEQDVYILTQSALQKILVNKFIDLTREQIEKHTTKYFAIMRHVLKPFGHSSPSLAYGHDLVVQNKNTLLQTFNKKVYNFLNRYPNNPYNVRFTQEQIDQYFENCVKIVKNFVEREKLQEWIFESHGVLNQDYDQLARNLWLQIFNCGDAIFEPLQAIDNRFKLLDDTSSNNAVMRKNVGSIMKALEGEVKLSHASAEFNPAKNSLLEKDRQIRCIRSLNSLHNENCDLNININLYKPDCLLIPPRNLEELIAYDKYQRQLCFKGNSKIFEE